MAHHYIFIAFLCDNFSQSNAKRQKYSNSNLVYPSIGKTCFFSMPKNFFCILMNAKSTTFRHTRHDIKSFQEFLLANFQNSCILGLKLLSSNVYCLQIYCRDSYCLQKSTVFTTVSRQYHVYSQ